MATTTPTHVRREQRIAAARAARASAPQWEERTITLDELRAGDFLLTVPTQAGVRGLRCETLVGNVETVWDQWGRRSARRSPLIPVASITVTPADRRLAVVSYPADFTATIRREC